MDHEELLSRIKVRSGTDVDRVAAVAAIMRGRACKPEADEVMSLVLELAMTKAPRELEATLNPTEAIAELLCWFNGDLG